MNINNHQDAIIQKFSTLDDWMDKYEYLITQGKNLPAISSDLKTEENVVAGCQSSVWVVAELIDGKINYVVDSDTLITKGLISVVISVLNKQSPEDIASANLYFIDKIGLKSNLSPSRANGLMSIVKRMKNLALLSCS